jgi:hypothetical protein
VSTAPAATAASTFISVDAVAASTSTPLELTRRCSLCIRTGSIQVRSGEPQRLQKETQKHPPERRNERLRRDYWSRASN